MKAFYSTLLILTAIVLIGCESTQSLNQPATDIVVAVNNQDGLRIVRPHVTQQDNALLVHGTVRRDLYQRSNLHGHVLVSLMDDAGQVIAEKQVDYSQALLIPDGIRRSPFQTAFEGVTTTPSKVNLSVHDKADCKCDA
ncbi:MAG: hypothetical protein ACF8OB_19175 [Phycisphaeraceae bacterium JB051]